MKNIVDIKTKAAEQKIFPKRVELGKKCEGKGKVSQGVWKGELGSEGGKIQN